MRPGPEHAEGQACSKLNHDHCHTIWREWFNSSLYAQMQHSINSHEMQADAPVRPWGTYAGVRHMTATPFWIHAMLEATF